jgi:hypothetical protein
MVEGDSLNRPHAEIAADANEKLRRSEIFIEMAIYMRAAPLGATSKGVSHG